MGQLIRRGNSDEALQAQQDWCRANQVQDKKELLDWLQSDALCAALISADFEKSCSNNNPNPTNSNPNPNNPSSNCISSRDLIVKRLKTLLNDSNSLIVQQTMRVCGDLALKLGKVVRDFAQELAPLLFEKFKDKCISNAEVLRTLTCFRRAMKFERIKDLVKQGLASPNYVIRTNSI